MQTTTNYGLKKPEATDFYNIEDMNYNSNVIDEALHELQESASVPTASASTLGGVKVGDNLSIDENGVLSATDTTYGLATTAQDGLMSASDKTKLDGSAPLATPTFTGSPKAPTKPATDNSTNIATTAHVKAVLDDKIVMSTTDLEDGVSELATGTLYLVYEDAE